MRKTSVCNGYKWLAHACGIACVRLRKDMRQRFKKCLRVLRNSLGHMVDGGRGEYQAEHTKNKDCNRLLNVLY